MVPSSPLYAPGPQDHVVNDWGFRREAELVPPLPIPSSACVVSAGRQL